MKPLTAQEIFNVGLQEMRQRDYCPAVAGTGGGDYGSCRYRGGPAEAPMCLIGLVIPDELYDDQFEGKTIRTIINEAEKCGTNYRLRQLLSGVDLKFLSDWQVAHDSLNGRPRNEWAERFERSAGQVALEWGLAYKPPVQAPCEA